MNPITMVKFQMILSFIFLLWITMYWMTGLGILLRVKLQEESLRKRERGLFARQCTCKITQLVKTSERAPAFEIVTALLILLLVFS